MRATQPRAPDSRTRHSGTPQRHAATPRTLSTTVAVVLASVNIFGGFAVTERMLAMYKKKERK